MQDLAGGGLADAQPEAAVQRHLLPGAALCSVFPAHPFLFSTFPHTRLWGEGGKWTEARSQGSGPPLGPRPPLAPSSLTASTTAGVTTRSAQEARGPPKPQDPRTTWGFCKCIRKKGQRAIGQLLEGGI